MNPIQRLTKWTNTGKKTPWIQDYFMLPWNVWKIKMLKKQHIIKAVFSILQTIIDLDYHILKGFRASFTKHMPVQILKKHE